MALTFNELKRLLDQRQAQHQDFVQEIIFDLYQHPFFKALEALVPNESAAASAAGASDRPLRLDELDVIAEQLYRYRNEPCFRKPPHGVITVKPLTSSQVLYSSLLEAFPEEDYIAGYLQHARWLDEKAGFVLARYLIKRYITGNGPATIEDVVLLVSHFLFTLNPTQRDTTADYQFDFDTAKRILSFLIPVAEDTPGHSHLNNEVFLRQLLHGNRNMQTLIMILGRLSDLSDENLQCIKRFISKFALDHLPDDCFVKIRHILYWADRYSLTVDDKHLALFISPYGANIAMKVMTILRVASQNDLKEVCLEALSHQLSDDIATLETQHGFMKYQHTPLLPRVAESTDTYSRFFENKTSEVSKQLESALTSILDFVEDLRQRSFASASASATASIDIVSKKIAYKLFRYPFVIAVLKPLITARAKSLSDIEAFFETIPDGLSLDEAKKLTKSLRELSTLYSRPHFDTSPLAHHFDRVLFSRHVADILAHHSHATDILMGIAGLYMAVGQGYNLCWQDAYIEKLFALTKEPNRLFVCAGALNYLGKEKALNTEASIKVLFDHAPVALGLCALDELSSKNTQEHIGSGAASAAATMSATTVRLARTAENIINEPDKALALAAEVGATYTDENKRSGSDFQRAKLRFISLYRAQVVAQLEKADLAASVDRKDVIKLGAKRRQFYFFNESNQACPIPLLINIAAQASEILPPSFVEKELTKHFTKDACADLQAFFEEQYRIQSEPVDDASAAAAAAAGAGAGLP